MSLTVHTKPQTTEEHLLKENNLNKSILLDESFYQGMRNPLTAKKLSFNIELAKKIRKPASFGNFDSETDYLDTLNLFLESTLETRHRGIFFLRKVLPQLSRKDTLLEIGPGNGQLIKWVGNFFKEVTALDVNKKALELLNVEKKILRNHIRLNKVYGSLFDIDFLPNEHNLVVLSHVLYYLPRERWTDIIKKTYKTVKKNGILAIALSGDTLGKANLTSFYGGKTININELKLECTELFKPGSIEIFTSKEIIIAKNLNAMLHIAGFCLHDAKITASKNSLTSYINTNFKIKENLFEMTTKQNFILIYKR